MQPFISRRLFPWLGFIPVVLAFVGMTVLSWRKWGDVIIDFGSNLYAPWQLVEGKVLYRDILWLFGPFSQYYHALLFKCFGVSLTTLIFSSLCLTAVCIIMVYLLFRQATDNVGAMVGCLVLVIVFAFAQYIGNGNYNYICPYNYEAVHGLFASIAVIGFLILWFFRRNVFSACVAGFFFGLVFLTKPEVFVAIAAAVLVAFVIECLGKRNLRAAVGFLFCAMIPVAVFAIYFCRMEGIHVGLHNTFWNWIAVFKVPIAKNKFYQWCLGLDEPQKNALLMLQHFGGVLAATAICVLCCRLQRDTGAVRKVVSVLFLCALVAAAFQFDWMQCGRALPLLSPIICLHLLWSRWKASEPDVSLNLVFPILWSVFGFVLLAKMGLNCRIWHYGFVLAMPAALSVVYYLGYFLPNALKGFGVNVVLFRGTVYVLLGVGIFSLLGRSIQFYHLRDLPVGKNGDMSYMFDPDFDPTGKDLNLVLDWFEANVPAGATFVAIPHGLGINYLTRHADPVRYTEFIPHVLQTYGNHRIAKQLEAAHPDYIVLVHVDTTEHGARFFGESPEYGAEILRWINTTYRPVYLAGAEPLQNENFGIKILGRKPIP
ncbi:MAG: glycosyltransferase family 39 protein [Chthoniobacteraceae bacterium]